VGANYTVRVFACKPLTPKKIILWRKLTDDWISRFNSYMTSRPMNEKVIPN